MLRESTTLLLNLDTFQGTMTSSPKMIASLSPIGFSAASSPELPPVVVRILEFLKKEQQVVQDVLL